MTEKTRVLFALEMVGTVNALKRTFGILEGERNCALRFAASDVALSALTGAGRECITLERDPSEVIAGFRPNVVVVGGSAFERDHPKWTGIELRYGLIAMASTAPVVFYRDYSGIPKWSAELSEHPISSEMLTYLMFDRMTARAVAGRRAKRVEVVGSGFYDDLPNWDWAEARRASRAKLEISEDTLVILFNAGADAPRVLECLKPVVEGLLRIGAQNVVFIPGFHPKDPDAPYGPGPTKGVWLPKPSVPYDPVFKRLEGSGVRVIHEPRFRNLEPDSQRRMAVADLLVMNPGSTETWTAVYGGIPQVITALPLTVKMLVEKGIEVEQFDFVADGTADISFARESLELYIADFPEVHLASLRERARAGKKKYAAEPAAPKIAEAILEAAGISSSAH